MATLACNYFATRPHDSTPKQCGHGRRHSSLPPEQPKDPHETSTIVEARARRTLASLKLLWKSRPYSTPILTAYDDDENPTARHTQPRSRKDLDHFITTLDHQVLSAEDESLVRQIHGVWEDLRERYSVSRSPSPPSPTPVLDHRQSFQQARADWLDSRLTEQQRSMLSRSGDYAKLRRVRCREHLRPDSTVHLRGGADGEPTSKRARTTLPPLQARTALPDDARPSRLLWWLAGGNISRACVRPTIGELRVRKEVELANRELVGVWDTVAGRRRIGKVSLLDASPEVGKDEVEKAAEVKTVDVEEESKAEMKAIKELVAEQVKAIKEEISRKHSAEAESAPKSEEVKKGRPTEVEDGEE
ncbi:hypothetical protein LTR95_008156 [Oleoguttula sp. CCFEE 5521]